ncbi:MAG: signal recognition particle-docking protein FtsY [Vicinamibacteria bacterium]|jgi:fused signal recognition particle receptor|nr:signal recognition particle-docking protein FtsY [Vicinamibacteria bacterium]
MGLLEQFKQGLSRTRAVLNTDVSDLVRGLAKLDTATLDTLEERLVAADFGPAAAGEILVAIRRDLTGGSDPALIRETLKSKVRAILDIPGPQVKQGTPHVIFVVGVNGVGKTTTIGKMASRYRAAGESTLIVAADTFRAAAVGQLKTWADRAGASFHESREGQDPASVVTDGLRKARAAGTRRVLVDTAGRLQNKVHLMAELAKMGRIAAREADGAPHETLLVLDATTGSNGLAQAQEFARAIPLTGLVLTKLDGTAKGGIAVAIVSALKVPIRFVGLGEGLDDLVPFDAASFAQSLLD